MASVPIITAQGIAQKHDWGSRECVSTEEIEAFCRDVAREGLKSTLLPLLRTMSAVSEVLKLEETCKHAPDDRKESVLYESATMMMCE